MLKKKYTHKPGDGLTDIYTPTGELLVSLRCAMSAKRLVQLLNEEADNDNRE